MIKVFFISILIFIGNYMLYLLLRSKAEERVHAKLKIANHEFDNKNSILQRQIADLELQRQKFETQKCEAHAEVNQKEEKVRTYYQQAVAIAEEAKKIREEAKNKVAEIEQRYSKLQHELYCARQRSKKLEKQIKPVL